MTTRTRSLSLSVLVLKKTGDPDAARELQTLALAVLNNPEIRNAVTQ